MTSKLDKTGRCRTIDVLLFEGVNLLDVSGPVQAFETAQIEGRKRYRVRYVSLDGAPVRAGCGLRMMPDAALQADGARDDLLIPGGAGVDALLDDIALRRVIAGHLARVPHGRLISVCSGALVLAAAGVLDGMAATTHWSRAAHIKQFDRVHWDLDRISTAQGRVFTSAGVTTGIDLALSIVRRDCGSQVALDVAREMVVQLRRTGGQSQYALHLEGQFNGDDALSALIERVVSAPHLVWTQHSLTQAAGMNTRTLARQFRRHLDETPAGFVARVRVDHARGLIAARLPLKQVAAQSGFGDLQRMRRAFQRRFGVHLSDYVNTFAV